MTTRAYLETSPQQPAKRQKSFHDLSDQDTTMTDTNMSGMQPASSIASTYMHLSHGPLDHELHGPISTSAYTPSTSSLGASDPTHPTTQGLNSSLMTGTAAQTNGSSQGVIAALQVKKLSANAKVPTRGSKFAAGYDMYAAETKTVPARGKAMIGTGIAIAVPVGTYGRVAPRSGLASKHSIATGAGVIDYDYRGEVKVLLFNHSDVDFVIQEGDRMAQLVLERIVTPEVMEVQDLEDSERGAGGFGSTGGFGVVVGNVGV